MVGEFSDVIVGSVSARDVDSGRNSDVMYYFTKTQHEFALDPFTGEIRSKVIFDREEMASYSLHVEVEIDERLLQIEILSLNVVS